MTHGVSFDLQPGWLRTHELEREHRPNYRPGNFGGQPTMELAGRRSFAVMLGGERFVVSVDFMPVDGPTAFASPAEPDRQATDGEILTLVARMFLGSLPQYPPAEPDLEAGYEEYRRTIAETEGYPPRTWENLRSEEREAFAAMVRGAWREGGEVRSDLPERVAYDETEAGNGTLELEFADGRTESYPYECYRGPLGFRRIFPLGSLAILNRYGIGEGGAA